MKNNTLAIALASMLVGGVAVAAFQNNRPAQPQADTSAAGHFIIHDGGTTGADAPFGDAIPARGALDYADVLDVKPVTERERMYATVIGSEPVRESSTVNTPREVCNDVVVQERLPERDGNVGGTVAGAVIGGLVGNQIGGGNGRKIATVGGAVAGGYIGNRIDRNHVGGQVVNRTDRQCRTVMDSSTSSRVVAYNVTYRNPDGSTDTMRTGSKPGSRIALGSETRTVGYDVTYRYQGQEHTVRMDERPGQRLPVLDGQVVTRIAAANGATTRG